MNLKNGVVHFCLLPVALMTSALARGEENQPTSQSKSEICPPLRVARTGDRLVDNN